MFTDYSSTSYSMYSDFVLLSFSCTTMSAINKFRLFSYFLNSICNHYSSTARRVYFFVVMFFYYFYIISDVVLSSQAAI